MKIIHKTKIFVCAVVALMASGVAPAYAGTGNASNWHDGKQLSESDRRRYDYFFLEAVNQQAAGNLSAAFDLFRHALEINPGAAESYYNLAGYYITMRNDSLAKFNFAKAAELDPTNTTYLEKLGQFYINLKDYPSAIKAYESLYAIQHDNPDIITIMMQLYGTQNDYDKMIAMLDRLETVQGSSDRISLTKMQIYEQQGKKKEQEEELKSLVANRPNDPNYRVMYGNWLLRNNKSKEAYKQLSVVLKDDPANLAARLSLLDYYNAKKLNAKRDELLRQLVVEKDVPVDTKMTLIRQTIINNEQQHGDSAAMFRLIDEALAQPQENGQIYLLKAAYMSLHKMPVAEIDSVYRQALEVEPDNAHARLLLLQDVWSAKDYDRVIDIAHPGQEYNPDDMAFYYFEGLAHFMKKDNDLALETFQKGVSQINKDSDPDIVADFYAIMGDILHEKGQDSLAFDSYDKCLKWKPDNVSALNNYAYYLSELNRDLTRAEQMSRKTIDAEPDNSTFLDTYAWILFMEGKYADAKTYIVRAIENDSTLSDVVLEHAGDIFSQNGEIDEAVEYWRKAAAKGDGSAVLQRKIELRKYIKE